MEEVMELKKIGIIGLGDIAQKAYLPLITNMELPLVLCTRNEEKLIKLTRKYRVNDYCKNYRELPDYGVNAVFVHSSTDSHYEIVRFFLESGINVFVDKPVSDDIDKVMDLYELAKRKNLILYCGFNRRWIKPVKEMRDLGKPDTVFVQKNRLNLPGDIRTFIFDDFIHVADTLLYLFQETDYEITYNAKVINGEIHHLTVMLSGEESTAIGMMNRVSGKKEERIEFIRNNEKIILKELVETQIYENENIHISTFGDWTSTLDKRGFQAMISDFIDLVRSDSSEMYNPELAIESHKLCNYLIEAIENDYK